MLQLAYRQSSQDTYRISFDGVEVGSVSLRCDHSRSKEYWHWGIDTMPLMDHGSHPPSGDAWSFQAALQAFKTAFLEWHAELPPSLWECNRDHIKAG